MPDITSLSHRDGSPEDRFLGWLDELVDRVRDDTPAPDTDFADVAQTARNVQRAAGLDTSMPIPTDREDAIWEVIMQNTTTAVSTPPPMPRQETRSPDVIHPETDPPGWRSILATAALILVILAASALIVWRVAGPFGDGGNADGTSNMANQPGIAGPGTPAAESPDGCPLTSDMLVFVGKAPANIADAGMTYVLVELDSDLVIACPGIEQPQLLLTGVVNAAPLSAPGTVLLELVGGEAIAYNVATGAVIDFIDFDTASRYAGMSPGSPWLLTPTGPDMQVTNLRTMRGTKLAALAGGHLPEGYAPVVVSSPGSPFAVITHTPSGVRMAELPGTALLVDETFNYRRWIDALGQVIVSDDAIAYRTQIDGQSVIRVENAHSGETVLDVTDVTAGASSHHFAFAGDGSTLVYLNGEEQLWRAMYQIDGEGQPPTRQIIMTDQSPTAVHSTGVPGHVLVEQLSDEFIGDPGTGGARAFSLLNTDTGEVTKLPGVYPHIDPDALNQFASLQYLVTIEPSSDSESRIVAHLTDLATGEVVLTSDPINASPREIVEGNGTLGESTAGAVATIGPPGGEVTLLDATSGTVATITPPAPDTGDGIGDYQWRITPTPTGVWLFALGIPQPDEEGLDITSPSDPLAMGVVAITPVTVEPEWTQVSDAQLAGFILGVDSDGPRAEEPVRLDAQVPVSLETSPVATPAIPIAESDACDLTGDITLVAGDVEHPVGNTMLRLRDGGLNLTCNGSDSTVAEGVVSAQLTTWPGAVLLTMNDASLRGMNLVTGGQGELGSATRDDGIAAALR